MSGLARAQASFDARFDPVNRMIDVMQSWAEPMPEIAPEAELADPIDEALPTQERAA